MGSIGLSLGQSDNLIYLYCLVLVVALFLVFKRKCCLLMGIRVLAAMFIIYLMTSTFVRTVLLTDAERVWIWQHIYSELVVLRKTYGVMELRLMIHFLVKRIQLKTFYGKTEFSADEGLELIRTVELWQRMLLNELRLLSFGPTFRVRVICLEKAIGRGLCSHQK